MGTRKYKNQKKLFVLIIVCVLTLLLGATTYAFFSYSRTSTIANILQAGGISFNATESGVMTLSNVAPITSIEAESDTTNAKTITLSVTGNTDYNEGLEYLVTANNVNLASINGKVLPIRVNLSVSGNGLGSEETGNYYTNHTSYGAANKYKVLSEGILEEGSRLFAGYIAPNSEISGTSGVNGTISVTAYVDANKILISDTYNAGTPASAGTGKEIFTTEEWNAITASNNLSFKIKVDANEGVWIDVLNASQSTLTMSNSSITLTHGVDSERSYTYNGNGIVTCTSSNMSYVSCSVDTVNKKIILTPKKIIDTPITVTVGALKTANYLSPTPVVITVNEVAQISAANISYDGGKTGFDCDNAKCAIDALVNYLDQ